MRGRMSERTQPIGVEDLEVESDYDGDSEEDDYEQDESSGAGAVQQQPVFLLGREFLDENGFPPMQQMGKMDPRVREIARQYSAKLVKLIDPLLLDPRSDAIQDIKERKTRDNTVSCVLYAAYRRSDCALLKVGYASTFRTRKELGYNDDDDVDVRMIFRIDGMPREMDQEAVKVYHEFWDAIRDDDKIHPFYHGLEKLVRERRAGGLGLDKKILSGLLEHGVQRKCNLSGRILESLTVDADVLEKREAMVRDAFEALCPILDETLQLDECDHDVEARALSSWVTALYLQGQLSSEVIYTEHLVGKNWRDCIEHARNPTSRVICDVYGEGGMDFTEEELEGARGEMHAELAYAASDRERPLLLFVNRNERSGWPNGNELQMVIEEQYGFTQVAEVFGDEVIVYTNSEARSVLCLYRPLCIAADALGTTTVKQAVLRNLSAAFLTLCSRHATGGDLEDVHRPLDAAARAEWIRLFNMGSRHLAVIGRETISDDSINAILESNLPVASDDRERPVGNRGKYSKKGTLNAIANNKSTRVDDNDVLIRALVRLTRASSIAEFNAAMEDAHEDFLRDVGTSGRHTRYRLLTNDWLVPGSKTLKLVEEKKASMMANVGNAGARNHTNEEIEENNESIAPLCKLRIGARFWLLDVDQSVPSAMPATILSPNPKHNVASYPAYRMMCIMVRSRVPRDYDKDPVYARQTPANRPPYGWDVEIVGKHLKTLSRKKVNGSTFVLVTSKKQ